MLYLCEIAVKQGKGQASRERRCFALKSYKGLVKILVTISPAVYRKDDTAKIKVSYNAPWCYCDDTFVSTLIPRTCIKEFTQKLMHNNYKLLPLHNKN